MQLRSVWITLVVSLLWTPAASAQVDIFVSVLPLKYLVERVGGNHVRVESMVKPGHSPVTYEPTPRQMAALSAAQAYLRVGVPFETFWIKPIQETNPSMHVIDARQGIAMLPMHDSVLNPGDAGQGRGGDHQHEGKDPHVWLDPKLAGAIAQTVRDYLARTDPDNGDDYRRNTAALLTELAQLDDELRQLTVRAESRKFLTFHPAWGYFARAYGLRQIAVEQEGKEPGPRALADLVELIRGEGISTVFVQRQFSSRAAETLAQEIGGRVVMLDPLAEDYFANLRAAARAISDSTER